MPRKPLSEISQNIRRGPELTPYKRGLIIGASDFGGTLLEISLKYTIPQTTIRNTINQAPNHLQGVSKPRSGRPRKLTSRDEYRIVWHARRRPRITYHELQFETGLSISHSLFYRVLKKYHITNWLTKKRPLLTEAVARERLEWARIHVN